MGHQCPDTDDRVVDVLGELVAQFGSNVIIALPGMAIGSGEAFQVRDGFDIPNYHAAHVDVFNRLPIRRQTVHVALSEIIEFRLTARPFPSLKANQ